MARTQTIAVVLAVLMGGVPAMAQTIVSTHPPLSPAEAVRVLRASDSPADRTDALFVDLDGPRIVIFQGSTTPWDWPAEAFTPIRPLSDQPYGYWSHASHGYRLSAGRLHVRSFAAPSFSTPRLEAQRGSHSRRGR
jgi:hypothetical protein